MKKITLLFCLLLGINLSAQDINFDTSDNWVTFMNVFELDGVTPAFPGVPNWGVPDLVVLVDNPSANNITLKPNRIGDTTDPFWQSGTLVGNKIMDANFYVQDNTLAGSSFTFNGNVASNTLNDTGMGGNVFAVTAFIKVFAADYSSVLDSDIIDLRATSGDFTLTMDASSYTNGENIQYGFQFIGRNVGCIDAGCTTFQAEYDALGGIVVAPNNILSVSNNELSSFKATPNPSKDRWNIKGLSTTINTIEVFDILGKRVQTLTPNQTDAAIDGSQLKTGIYMAKLYTDNGTKTIKLIKN